MKGGTNPLSNLLER